MTDEFTDLMPSIEGVIAQETLRYHVLGEEFDAYMQLPNHEGNCHCYRCMNEFNEYMRNKK